MDDKLISSSSLAWLIDIPDASRRGRANRVIECRIFTQIASVPIESNQAQTPPRRWSC